ncbi:unnamed protein product [Cyprideis torosa]|uniref:Uncharacterized protein n=1 Tax=Cyprideis torosa TaxID=163714 RepID=A0A7R8W4D0_9CRUS|nr:unnamed protein product [Cyprideis torosa]CAG0883000.1 unnamed protein product [Cyprideis torosa]
MFATLAAIFFTFLSGVIVTLVIQWHFFVNYLMKLPETSAPEKESFRKSELPHALIEALGAANFPLKEGCTTLNLVLSMLFNEAKHFSGLRHWILNKMDLEFQDLLTRYTAGRFITRIKIRHLDLGKSVPILKNMEVDHVQVHPQWQIIETLDIVFNMEYKGGLHVALDADLVLGKNASVAVKLISLTGKVRLRLTREPFTHWSVAFVDDPTLDMRVESNFQGRPLPQLTSVVTNQIRRAIRKRHTLPFFKYRCKPFFPLVVPVSSTVSSKGSRNTAGLSPSGDNVFVVEVQVLETSRLRKPSDSSAHICFTLSCDAVSWVKEYHQHRSPQSNPFLRTEKVIDFSRLESRVNPESESPRGSRDNFITSLLGLSFKRRFIPELYSVRVVVAEVSAGSPAQTADVKPGSILISINHSRISSLSQVRQVIVEALNLSSSSELNKKDRPLLLVCDEPRTTEKESSPVDSPQAGSDAAGPPSRETTGKEAPKLQRSASGCESKKSDVPQSVLKAFPLQESEPRETPVSSSAPSSPIRTRITLTSPDTAAKTQDRLQKLEADVLASDIKEWTETTSGSQLGSSDTPSPPNSLIVEEESQLLDKDVTDIQFFLSRSVPYQKDIVLDPSLATTNFSMTRSALPASWLNLAVWTEYPPPITLASQTNTLLGHLSLPIGELWDEAQRTSGEHFIRFWYLKPPEAKASYGRKNPHSTYSGFDPSLCYGTVTLGISFSSCPPSPGEDPLGSATPSRSEGQGTREGDHIFLRGNVQTAICSVCLRKIWLKGGLTCSRCSMSCHKKCIDKVGTQACVRPPPPHPLEEKIKERGGKKEKGGFDAGQPEAWVEEGVEIGEESLLLIGDDFNTGLIPVPSAWPSSSTPCASPQKVPIVAENRPSSRLSNTLAEKGGRLRERFAAWRKDGASGSNPPSANTSLVTDGDAVSDSPALTPITAGKQVTGSRVKQMFSSLRSEAHKRIAARQQHRVSQEDSTVALASSVPETSSPRLWRSGSAADLSIRDETPALKPSAFNHLQLPELSFIQSQSRSLPASPVHSPAAVRKNATDPVLETCQIESLITAALSHDEPSDDEKEVVWPLETDRPGDQRSLKNLIKLIENSCPHPHSEGIVQRAKETGKSLYQHLPKGERIKALNDVLTPLQEAMDGAFQSRTSLLAELKKVDEKSDSKENAERLEGDIRYMINEIEARTQAMALLMLHYCSGLQSAESQVDDGDPPTPKAEEGSPQSTIV